MLIHLDDYRKAKAVNSTPAEIRYEEPLCVNWNPAFGLIAMGSFQRPHEVSPALPEDAAALGSVFINRVSALASQI